MKYDIERLETMGLKPGRDLCMVRVRSDDWDRVDDFLREGRFPYIYSYYDTQGVVGMKHLAAEYFFDTFDTTAMTKAEKETVKGFPFRNDNVLELLVYKVTAMGLVCLKGKLEQTLHNKISEKVFKVLSKKDWKEEVETMRVIFPPEITKEAGTNLDLPKEIMINAGIKMIERIIKSDALTVLDWRQKETGYQDGILAFDNFEQDGAYLTFTARAKGDPVKRLNVVTSDEENEDLYISWTILRDGTDLEAEDGVKLETWTAHKGRVYNKEGKVYNKETGTFDIPSEEVDKEEREIIIEETNLTEEMFRQDYLWTV